MNSEEKPSRAELQVAVVPPSRCIYCTPVYVCLSVPRHCVRLYYHIILQQRAAAPIFSLSLTLFKLSLDFFCPCSRARDGSLSSSRCPESDVRLLLRGHERARRTENECIGAALAWIPCIERGSPGNELRIKTANSRLCFLGF